MFSNEGYKIRDQSKADYVTFYYYHADHLGSNEVISDNSGAPHEFHLTLPFGETMAEQRKPQANYYNSWKFTGKELDEETGLYYFGARYYNPSWSVWLSVDPLVESFSNWTPYNYVYNSPINYTDKTGMCPDGDCPTNSRQINSQIKSIRANFPDAPIYLLVQSGNNEATSREQANSPSSLSYDRYTIQDGTDFSSGSFFVTLRHGDNYITGAEIFTTQVNEVEKSFTLSFVGAEGVGGADQLTSSSKSQLSKISSIINYLDQEVSISSNTIVRTSKDIDIENTPVKGLFNGKVTSVNLKAFGEGRISTVITGLKNAGADESLLSRGSVNVFNQINPNRRSGTFIDFNFSSPAIRNSNRKNHSGTININKGKFQIY